MEEIHKYSFNRLAEEAEQAFKALRDEFHRYAAQRQREVDKLKEELAEAQRDKRENQTIDVEVIKDSSQEPEQITDVVVLEEKPKG